MDARQNEKYTSVNGGLYDYLERHARRQDHERLDATDGTLNTMMVAEMGGRPHAYVTGRVLNPNLPDKTYGFGAWAHNDKHAVKTFTYDGQTSPGPCPVNCSNQMGVYSFHPAGANALFAYGSVHFIAQTIDLFTFFNLVACADGDVMAGDALNGSTF